MYTHNVHTHRGRAAGKVRTLEEELTRVKKALNFAISNSDRASGL